MPYHNSINLVLVCLLGMVVGLEFAWWGLVILAGVVLYFFRRGLFPVTTDPTSGEREWLVAKWTQAAAELRSGRLQIVDHWFFDEATAAQLGKLREFGVQVPADIKKGEASDLIGLFYPLDAPDRELLESCGVDTDGCNQTWGRYQVRNYRSRK